MPDEAASQPQIKIAWLIGTLAALALFAVIAAYSSRMSVDYPDYDQERAQVRYDTLNKLRHDEQALLSPVDAQGHPTAEWIDQAKGTIRIPIEEAMAKAVDTLKSKPIAMGPEIPAPPAPAPAKAAPAAGATNAAPAKPSAPAAKANASPTAAGPAAAATPPAKPDKSNK